MEIELILLVVMIIASAFFSGLEIALFSLGRAHVRSLVERGIKGAITVARLKANPDRLLVTILVGNNIANISAASMATALSINIFSSLGAGTALGVGVATGVMTLLILVFGEITPKTFAVRWSEQISLVFARPLEIFGWIFFPVIWVLEKFSRGMTFLFRSKVKQHIKHEVLLMSLARLGLEEGTIDEHEHRIVENAFRLDRIPADRIMTSRSDMVAVESGSALKDAVEFISTKPYTRFPVYQGGQEEIVGILHIRDLYEQIRLGKETTIIDEISAKPIYVPRTMPLNDLLLLFQKERIHMAVVIDEYGETAGIVTLEDVLEELVGEIEDEVDAVSHKIIRISNDRFLVYASLSLDDINRTLEIDLPAERYNTLNGLLLDVYQNIPQPKEKILYDGLTFIIRQADARKVILVEMILSTKSEE